MIPAIKKGVVTSTAWFISDNSFTLSGSAVKGCIIASRKPNAKQAAPIAANSAIVSSCIVR